MSVNPVSENEGGAKTIAPAPDLIQRLDKIGSILSNVGVSLSGAILIFVWLMVTVEIFLRAFSIGGSELMFFLTDFPQHINTYVVLIMGAVVLRHKSHINISMLLDKLHGKAKSILELVLILIGYYGAYILLKAGLALNSIYMKFKLPVATGGVAKIPQWTFTFCEILGAALLFLALTELLIKVIVDLKKSYATDKK